MWTNKMLCANRDKTFSYFWFFFIFLCWVCTTNFIRTTNGRWYDHIWKVFEFRRARQSYCTVSCKTVLICKQWNRESYFVIDYRTKTMASVALFQHSTLLSSTSLFAKTVILWNQINLLFILQYRRSCPARIRHELVHLMGLELKKIYF